MWYVRIVPYTQTMQKACRSFFQDVSSFHDGDEDSLEVIMTELGLEKSESLLCGRACPPGYEFNEPADGYTQDGGAPKKKKAKKTKTTKKKDKKTDTRTEEL